MMLKFFAGWRRKIGCLLLLIACAVSGAWARSYMIGDYIAVVLGGSKIAVLSQQGMVSGGLFSVNTKNPPAESQTGWWTVKLPAPEMQFVHYNAQAPYGGIVFPMLLIATCLVLFKPWAPAATLPGVAAATQSSHTKKTSARREKRSGRRKR